ncbi:hypothetical protein AOLI_G00054560 [Acnodon oligacanthus]
MAQTEDESLRPTGYMVFRANLNDAGSGRTQRGGSTNLVKQSCCADTTSKPWLNEDKYEDQETGRAVKSEGRMENKWAEYEPQNSLRAAKKDTIPKSREALSR